MEKTKLQTNNISKMPIDERLEALTSTFTTPEEWENYINNYYQAFCSVLAKLETKNNSTKTTRIERPIAIITGGQPGAGKTALISTYKQLLKRDLGIDAVINNADFYRFCVPGTYKIAIDFPEVASKLTDPVVKLMRQKLMEESINQGQSIIIENTLGDTIAFDIMKQSSVHEIWLALMAVPREESLLSDFERYIKMKEASDVARLVSIDAHDKRYYALDKIAQELENSGVRTMVHSRGKTENSPTTIKYDSNENNSIYRNATQAMTEIRRKTFNEQHSNYGERLTTIKKKMNGFGMTPDEKVELEKLENIIGKSISREEGR